MTNIAVNQSSNHLETYYSNSFLMWLSLDRLVQTFVSINALEISLEASQILFGQSLWWHQLVQRTVSSVLSLRAQPNTIRYVVQFFLIRPNFCLMHTWLPQDSTDTVIFSAYVEHSDDFQSDVYFCSHTHYSHISLPRSQSKSQDIVS